MQRTVGISQDVGLGHSCGSTASAAAAEALSAALGGRCPRRGDLVFVFATTDYDATQLMAEATPAASPATVVGCSAYGAFTTTAADPQAVVAAYVPAAGMSVGTAVVPDTNDSLYRASRDAAALAKEGAGTAHPHSVLILLSNQSGTQRDVVHGAYEVAGATVPLVGGAVGSDQSTAVTWQAVGERVVADGVTAVWLNSPEPLGVAVDHGWHPASPPLLVTRAEGNVVLELDGRPAADVYMEMRGPLRLDNRGFVWQALDKPFGLPTLDGGYVVRHIWNRTPEGGLAIFGYMHDQAVLRIMTSDHDQLVAGARRAAREASRKLGRASRGALVFSCSSRHELYGDRVGEENAALADELGGVPAAGFFTAGEYARTTGSTGFHNASVAVLAL